MTKGESIELRTRISVSLSIKKWVGKGIKRLNDILAGIAGVIAPVFAPLGFGDWRISTALITGFIAKESVVSTLSILFGSTAALTSLISTKAAAALLVFCLLYTPCVAAIASIRRELGQKWAIGVVILQCAIAWICAFLVYHALMFL